MTTRTKRERLHAAALARARAVTIVRRRRGKAGDSRAVGMATTTRQPCRWMCGNPRRYGKGKERLTMQERLTEDEFRHLL